VKEAMFIFMSKHNLPWEARYAKEGKGGGGVQWNKRQGHVFIGKRRILEFTVSRNTINKN